MFVGISGDDATSKFGFEPVENSVGGMARGPSINGVTLYKAWAKGFPGCVNAAGKARQTW